MERIVKRFPGVKALAEARLSVGRGEVHALVGENGAGKSTLIKILTGVYQRDSGSITLDGRPVAFLSPQQAQAGGVSTIYQEVNLVPLRSVAENIFLGREPRRYGILLDRRRMQHESAALLAGMGLQIDVTLPLGAYPIAVQQMVAVARAISTRSQLVVMDEPTSSLDEREVARLFEVIRRLKADGVSVIFVSHRFDELYTICDRVTIMRDGHTIDERPMAQLSRLELVSKMLGRELGALQRAHTTGFAAAERDAAELLVEGRSLRRGRALRDVSLSVRAGEIVGLGGLLGSGRTETARVLFGADKPEGGELLLDGKPARLRNPRAAVRVGIGFCSEDRKAEGIIPQLSVRENLTLAALPGLARLGVVSRERQQALVDRFIKRLGIRTTGPEQQIRELSGGNQQKVLLARWLCLNPRLLILDEPTRGIDVGARAEIQRLIDELAAAGLGVLMISSELEELTEGCDRVVVLRDGRSVAELPRAQLNEAALVAAIANAGRPPEEDANATP